MNAVLARFRRIGDQAVDDRVIPQALAVMGAMLIGVTVLGRLFSYVGPAEIADLVRPGGGGQGIGSAQRACGLC